MLFFIPTLWTLVGLQPLLLNWNSSLWSFKCCKLWGSFDEHLLKTLTYTLNNLGKWLATFRSRELLMMHSSLRLFPLRTWGQSKKMVELTRAKLQYHMERSSWEVSNQIFSDLLWICKNEEWITSFRSTNEEFHVKPISVDYIYGKLWQEQQSLPQQLQQGRSQK